MQQPEGPIEYDPTHVVTARWVEHPPTSRLPERVLTRGTFDVDSVPDVPWAFITVTHEAVLATSHPMWQRSLVWAHDGRGRFAVSHRLRDVVDWLPPERRGLADDFALRWLTGTRQPGTTPFAHVHAIAPGTALRIDRAGSVTTQEWLTEDDLPAPQLRGEHAVQQYLRAFDTTVRTLMNGQDILALRMSGGLDSTFVAAWWRVGSLPIRPRRWRQ